MSEKSSLVQLIESDTPPLDEPGPIVELVPVSRDSYRLRANGLWLCPTCARPVPRRMTLELRP